MAMSNYFNLYLAQNRKRLLAYVAAVAGLFIMAGLFFPMMTTFERYSANHLLYYACSTRDPYFYMVMPLYVMVAMLAVGLSGNLMFSSLHNNGERCSTLLLPAGHRDKWWTWFTVYILGSIVTVFVCYILAELVRMGVSMIFAQNSEAVHFIWVFSGVTGQGEISAAWMLVMTTLTAQMVMALGSVIWYRYSLAKTLLFWCVALYFASLAAVCLGAYFTVAIVGQDNFQIGMMGFGWLMDSVNDVWPFVNTMIGISFVWIALGYWLTYARLKENGQVFAW